MTKITTDFVGTESTAVTKQRLTDILEFWGYDPDAYTTWGNARANLNSLLSGTALGAIGATELAGEFLPKINFLNDPDAVIAAALFSVAEPGLWLDASDTSTLFQDTAGSTPVTTPGQTVARVNDKSGNGNHATQATAAARPTYGIVPEGGRRNLLTFTEEFDNSVWTKLNATINASGELTDNATNGQHYIRQDLTKPATATQYTLFFDVEAGSRNFCYVQSQEGGNFCRQYFNISTGTVGTGQSSGLTLDSAGITDIGNGLYRCRITFTSGTGTSLLNLLVAASADNSAAYAGNGDVALRVYKAQLETGTTVTPYQRVGTQFDVTEAGVPSLGYLSFDGVDDFLVTPTITPNTDKAQVFAGVRKLSDAAGMIIELSPRLTANNGSCYLINSSTIQVASKGTIAVTATTAISAPSTNVITGLGDISGDITTLRIDGTQVAQSTADQGIGNYLAYPLFIGSRAGTSLLFNGHIHQLITRFGPNLPTSDIQKAERYVASKTAGVTL